MHGATTRRAFGPPHVSHPRPPPIGKNDYAVVGDGKAVGRIRNASERTMSGCAVGLGKRRDRLPQLIQIISASADKAQFQSKSAEEQDGARSLVATRALPTKKFTDSNLPISSYCTLRNRCGWLVLSCFVCAQKFFCIMGSPPRYGPKFKRNQSGLPIANDPAFVDVYDFVHRCDPYYLTRSFG